ncbi:MAG: S8/S53 family peptidase [Arcicella sp.]|jgi:hypothetical protein|nr:S8/S53 family peptidase [Arcicella sp.]
MRVEELIEYLNQTISDQSLAKLKEYDFEIDKKTNYPVVKNQYIFQLKPTSKGDFEKNDGFKKELFSAGILSVKKTCRCNSNLKLIETNNIDDYSSLTEFINRSNLQIGGYEAYIILDGYYYQIIGSQPNIIIGNPDPDDPPPPPPRKDAEYSIPHRDQYLPLRESFLRGAKAHKQNLPDSAVVAILDSGIDLRYFEDIIPLNFYNAICGAEVNDCNICDKSLKNKAYGWSFIDEYASRVFPNNPYDDDLSHKHGTRIAKIIANVTQNNVRIMPLKTADYAGIHQYFDIYCAFEYILNYNKTRINLKDKVKIINASWGFYSNHSLPILDKYIEKLKDEQIYLVTSAGNDGLDISQYIYYPAAYSRAVTENFVYTVTSVKEIEEGRYTAQDFGLNYSELYVDAGVVADNEGGYKDPLNPNVGGPRIKGTSYAAAYFTGFLAEQMSNPNYNDNIAELKDGDFQAFAALGVRGQNNRDNNWIVTTNE